MTVPELSRLVRLDALGAEPKRLGIEADAAEREALAKRFALRAIARLKAEAELVRKDE